MIKQFNNLNNLIIFNIFVKEAIDSLENIELFSNKKYKEKIPI